MTLLLTVATIIPDRQTGMSFSTLWNITDAGVIIGAFAGASVFVLSSTELPYLKRMVYFIVAFMLGVLGADESSKALLSILGIILPEGTELGKSLSASVASAIGVSVLTKLVERGKNSDKEKQV